MNTWLAIIRQAELKAGLPPKELPNPLRLSHVIARLHKCGVTLQWRFEPLETEK